MKNKLYSLLLLLLVLSGCRNELDVSKSRNTSNTNHNSISFKDFKRETNIKKFQNFFNISAKGSVTKTTEVGTAFQIDTTTIYKLELGVNTSSYSFRAYNLYESPDKVFNVVYRKKNNVVDYTIVEIMTNNITKPLYDSRLGKLTPKDANATVSRTCTVFYDVASWHCKNDKSYDQCDKCDECFIITNTSVQFECADDVGGTAPSGTPPDTTFPSYQLPPHPANLEVEGPAIVLSDPSGYIFDPNVEPNIDAAYVRASRAYSFWLQLDAGKQLYAMQHPEIYQNIIENYLDHYSTANNTENLTFANWALEHFMQDPLLTWEMFYIQFLATPCEKTKAMLQKPEVQDKIADLKAHNGPNEKGWKFMKDGTPPQESTQSGAHETNLGDPSLLLGGYHWHPNIGMFSPQDIAGLIEIARYQPVGSNTIASDAFSGLITANGIHYVIYFNGVQGDLPANPFEKSKIEEWNRQALSRSIDFSQNYSKFQESFGVLNNKGREALFFDTLNRMGLNNKIILQEIDQNGNVSTIKLKSDGSGTESVPCK